MTFIRHCQILAAPSKEGALYQALLEIMGVVAKSEGCEGVELLREMSNPAAFVLVERWHSAAAHEKCRESLPKSALAASAAAQATPPIPSSFEVVKAFATVR